MKTSLEVISTCIVAPDKEKPLQVDTSSIRIVLAEMFVSENVMSKLISTHNISRIHLFCNGSIHNRDVMLMISVLI